ncbi:MAG: hypothetical protein H6812_04565 [Phycisphaeraceae bacterium]|nr:hypothetical protein [Phycisphaerales bacterium]MCB9842511.1 hypothetical protein [Phycisphaeraceae bacterium]
MSTRIEEGDRPCDIERKGGTYSRFTGDVRDSGGNDTHLTVRHGEAKPKS